MSHTANVTTFRCLKLVPEKNKDFNIVTSQLCLTHSPTQTVMCWTRGLTCSFRTHWSHVYRSCTSSWQH